MSILAAADQVLWEYNILASIAHLVLLAGYYSFSSGTFTCSPRFADGISHKPAKPDWKGNLKPNAKSSTHRIWMSALFHWNMWNLGMFIESIKTIIFGLLISLSCQLCPISPRITVSSFQLEQLGYIVKRTGWVYNNYDIISPPMTGSGPIMALLTVLAFPSLNIGSF
ncbi:hypothetical protein N7470_007983, partial [Penicillium chermesinum]